MPPERERPKDSLLRTAFGYAQAIHERRPGDHYKTQEGEYRMGEKFRLLYSVYDPPAVGEGFHSTGMDSTSHAVSFGYREGIAFQPRWTGYVSDGVVKVDFPRDVIAELKIFDSFYGDQESPERDSEENLLSLQLTAEMEAVSRSGLHIPSRAQVAAIIAGISDWTLPRALWIQRPSQTGPRQIQEQTAEFIRAIEEKAITAEEHSMWTDLDRNLRYSLATTTREGVPAEVWFERTRVLEERPKGLSPTEMEGWGFSRGDPKYTVKHRIAVPDGLSPIDPDVLAAMLQNREAINAERARTEYEHTSPSAEVMQRGLAYLRELAA